MDRVHGLNEDSLADIAHVAVAIGAVDSRQRHVGILHRDSESGSVLMLHLAWHTKLRNETPDPGFLWTSPAIHPRRLTQVAAICRKIWRSNKKDGIPFAFSQPNDCFDAMTGRFLFGPTKLGLTCATFVLAVFHAAGLQLVKYESWPVGRPGDAEWQRKIVALLERTGAAAEHVAAVRNEVGAVRYRPEEVAGAATVWPLPADFFMAAERGSQIVQALQAD